MAVPTKNLLVPMAIFLSFEISEIMVLASGREPSTRPWRKRMTRLSEKLRDRPNAKVHTVTTFLRTHQ